MSRKTFVYRQLGEPNLNHIHEHPGLQLSYETPLINSKSCEPEFVSRKWLSLDSRSNCTVHSLFLGFIYQRWHQVNNVHLRSEDFVITITMHHSLQSQRERKFSIFSPHVIGQVTKALRNLSAIIVTRTIGNALDQLSQDPSHYVPLWRKEI